MLDKLIAHLVDLLAATGAAGIFVAMLLESACVPVPSEVVLPFAGILVARGDLTFAEALAWSTAGQVAGSALAWAAGRYGGRSFLERYGRYVLLRRHELEVAERWFARWGEVTALTARLLPAVRTFISVPAGVAGMPLPRFLLYSTLGILPWSAGLIWLGMTVGEVWRDPRWHPLFRSLEVAVVVGGALALAWALWRARRRSPGAA